VNALTLAVTARLGRQWLVTLPENPPLDEFGLAMEIVYAEA
jgi:predicted RNase H-like nuclease